MVPACPLVACGGAMVPRSRYRRRWGPLAPSVGVRRTSPPAVVVRQMIERYQAGATLAKLADELGFRRMTVSRSLKKAGPRLRRSGLDEHEARRAIDLYESGMTLAKVGDTLSVAVSTVRRALHSRGAVLGSSGAERAPRAPRSDPRVIVPAQNDAVDLVSSERRRACSGPSVRTHVKSVMAMRWPNRSSRR